MFIARTDLQIRLTSQPINAGGKPFLVHSIRLFGRNSGDQCRDGVLRGLQISVQL